MKRLIFTLCFLLICGIAFAGTTDKLKSVVARMNVASDAASDGIHQGSFQTINQGAFQ